MLPPIIKDFMTGYPDVALQMQQGTPPQIAEMRQREPDFAIATEALQQFSSLILPLLCGTGASLSEGASLTQMGRLTLEAVAEHPIVTYTFGFTGRSSSMMHSAQGGSHPALFLPLSIRMSSKPMFVWDWVLASLRGWPTTMNSMTPGKTQCRPYCQQCHQPGPQGSFLQGLCRFHSRTGTPPDQDIDRGPDAE